jgi:hypothetical protein
MAVSSRKNSDLYNDKLFTVSLSVVPCSKKSALLLWMLGDVQLTNIPYCVPTPHNAQAIEDLGTGKMGCESLSLFLDMLYTTRIMVCARGSVSDRMGYLVP